ncbi:hypothetical protein Tco_0066696 [Tanacetum coccineum]
MGFVCSMAEIGCNWARIWAFKVFTVFIIILLGFPGPSDGLRLHPTVFFSSGSGLTADSSVLTLTLIFLDFGLDFAQSFPFHAQFWSWPVMTGSWSVMAGSGRLRLVMAGSGRIWPFMTGPGWVLAGTAGFARYASVGFNRAKRVEGSFKVPRPKVSSMTTSIDEDLEKSSLVNHDDVGSGVSSSGQNKSRNQTTEERSAKYASTSLSERVTPSSRSSKSSRSGDHRRSRRDSTEYRDRSEQSPRHGRDYRDYDNKRSRYESSRRTPGIAHLQIGGYFGRNNV